MIRYSSLKWPIILGIVLLALIVVLLVIWIIDQASQQEWALLTVGTIFFALILIGVVLYLILSIKEVRLNRRQANFIDSITHELKSPIASIKLYLQTLDMREVSSQQQQEFHRFMLEDVRRLDSLIDHLLIVARLGHDEQQIAPEDIPVLPLLQRCVDVVARQYDLSPDRFETEVTPCSIHGRSRDLEVVLTNLLDNAAKYSGEDPRIHITAEPRKSGRVVISISDNGKGVGFELRRKIFRRFFREGSELVRTTKGTGLGLHIVNSLVVKLKGKISVHGRGSLRGATFDVDLPGKILPDQSTATPP